MFIYVFSDIILRHTHCKVKFLNPTPENGNICQSMYRDYKLMWSNEFTHN